jgi:choline dehydrogenase
MKELLRGLSICRDIAQAEPLAGRLAKEILPGPSVMEETALRNHVRRTVKTNYHPCGTVRMGQIDDELAPLGPDGAVKGVRGLWVVDASAMPTIPSANTNAPVMAMADRIMDGVLGVR